MGKDNHGPIMYDGRIFGVTRDYEQGQHEFNAEQQIQGRRRHADGPGPAGTTAQNTGTSTDAMMNAQILCYMRSKGTLAGAALDGAMIEMDGDDMQDVYVPDFNCKEILGGAKTNANTRVTAFSEMLSRYTSRQAKK